MVKQSWLARPRGKSLLAYLLLHHATPQDRAHLAYTFWPETSDSQARTNLRRELHQLRHSSPLFAALIQSDGQSVQWQMPAAGTLDVAEFTRLLRRRRPGNRPATRIESYRAASELYQGDLLPGLQTSGSCPSAKSCAKLISVRLKRSRRSWSTNATIRRPSP
ncbi:MAG: hypothetical protein R2867_38525 [Caldilineaceae bacterium]